MAKTLIIEIGEIGESIRQLLMKHAFSHFVNIDDVLIGIFEIACGALSDGSDIAAYLLNYKIPPYVTLSLLPQWVNKLRTDQLLNYLQTTDIFKYQVSYSIVGCDMIITLADSSPIKTLDEAYMDHMRESMDNWDYIPERMRREFQL